MKLPFDKIWIASVGISCFLLTLICFMLSEFLRIVSSAGRFYLVHWYHLFVIKEYHMFFDFARWDAPQKEGSVFVRFTDLRQRRTKTIDMAQRLWYSDSVGAVSDGAEFLLFRGINVISFLSRKHFSTVCKHYCWQNENFMLFICCWRIYRRPFSFSFCLAEKRSGRHHSVFPFFIYT